MFQSGGPLFGNGSSFFTTHLTQSRFSSCTLFTRSSRIASAWISSGKMKDSEEEMERRKHKMNTALCDLAALLCVPYFCIRGLRNKSTLYCQPTGYLAFHTVYVHVGRWALPRPVEVQLYLVLHPCPTQAMLRSRYSVPYSHACNQPYLRTQAWRKETRMKSPAWSCPGAWEAYLP